MSRSSGAAVRRPGASAVMVCVRRSVDVVRGSSGGPESQTSLLRVKGHRRSPRPRCSPPCRRTASRWCVRVRVSGACRSPSTSAPRGRLGWQNCPSTQGWRKPQRIRGYPPDMTRACRSGPLSTRPVGPGVPENGSCSGGPADLLLHARCRTLLADPQGRLLDRVGVAQRYRPLRHMAEPDLGGRHWTLMRPREACLEGSVKHEAELSCRQSREKLAS